MALAYEKMGVGGHRIGPQHRRRRELHSKLAASPAGVAAHPGLWSVVVTRAAPSSCPTPSTARSNTAVVAARLMPDNLPLLYLDIDGVLLCRRHPGMFDGFELALGCLDFLEWATTRFQCRWLSMRCRSGFLDGSRRAFRAAGAPLDDRRSAVMNLIEPAAWRVEKTEPIDPASDFWWIDDNPSERDRDWLRAHNRQDRLIEVSCDRDPGALLHARSLLPGASTNGG
jgi:hypothetical protein